MFCSKCGAKIEDNAKFCANCGTKIERNESLSKKKKWIRTFFVCGFVCIVLGLLGWSGVTLVMSMNVNSESSPGSMSAQNEVDFYENVDLSSFAFKQNDVITGQDNMIYYYESQFEDTYIGDSIFAINNEGEHNEIAKGEHISKICIINDRIYYSERGGTIFDENGYQIGEKEAVLWSIKEDGTDKKEIMQGIESFEVYDEHIYYISSIASSEIKEYYVNRYGINDKKNISICVGTDMPKLMFMDPQNAGAVLYLTPKKDGVSGENCSYTIWSTDFNNALEVYSFDECGQISLSLGKDCLYIYEYPISWAGCFGEDMAGDSFSIKSIDPINWKLIESIEIESCIYYICETYGNDLIACIGKDNMLGIYRLSKDAIMTYNSEEGELDAELLVELGSPSEGIVYPSTYLYGNRLYYIR